MTFTPTQRLLLVTGPAGAGRGTVLKALEDMGFEAIDNIPCSLVPRLVRAPLERPMALGLDPRNRDFSVNALLALVEALAGMPRLEFDLVFLDCDAETLARRFSETRRRHPLLPDQPPRDGIELEMRLLSAVRERADVLIDTSTMTPHDLRAEVARRFDTLGKGVMAVQVQSFSYKRGIPVGMDMVFDCRFLQNPHWQPELRAKTGRDPQVTGFVEADPRFDGFFTRLEDMILSLLPAFAAEGKAQLSIGFGCTGGQHRSVAVAEKLLRVLARTEWRAAVRHRELERMQAAKPDSDSGQVALLERGQR